jgi:hypothetical protein
VAANLRIAIDIVGTEGVVADELVIRTALRVEPEVKIVGCVGHALAEFQDGGSIR